MSEEWQAPLGDFPEHLESIGLSASSLVKIIPQALRFIDLMGKAPHELTKDDMVVAAKRQRSAAGSQSYLALRMISLGRWPKDFLRQRAQVGAIEKYLAPKWRRLLERLEGDLDRLNVPEHSKHYFRRCATIFLWWSALPELEEIHESLFRKEWERFWRESPDAASSIIRKVEWNPERCYAAIWNAALAAGLVKGAAKQFEAAAPPFWKTVPEPIRGVAHKLYGSGGLPQFTEIRRRRLLYALTRLGFCAHGAPRNLNVDVAEWLQLEQTLLKEMFARESIGQCLKDARAIFEILRKPGHIGGDA